MVNSILAAYFPVAVVPKGKGKESTLLMWRSAMAVLFSK